MKSIILILFVTIVTTTPVLEARQEPKVLIYEVTEQDGDTPHVELLKVGDLNLLDDDDTDQQLNKDQLLIQNYRDESQKKNRHKTNKYRNSNKYRLNNQKESDIYGLNRDINRYESHKNNRESSKNKQNNDLAKLLSNLNSQYVNWDSKSNWNKRQSQRLGKHSSKNNENYQRVSYSEDYADFGENDYLQSRGDVLLAQLLAPKKRDKREVERVSIISRLKRLVKRLKELDSEGEAKLNGKVFLSKDDANKLSFAEGSGEFADKTFSANHLTLSDINDVLQGNQNSRSALRTGATDDNEDLNALLDDRTQPPPPRYIYDRE